MEQSLYLSVLHDTATAVAASDGMDDALAETVAIVARRIGFDVCSIYLYHSEDRTLVLRASHGLRSESVGQVVMGLDEGLTGMVARRQRPFFTADATQHPRWKYFPETGEERFTGFGGVPLLRRAELVGVLTVRTREPHEFHANEIVMLQALAGLVVSVFDVARLIGPGAAPEGAHAVDAPRRQALTGIGTSPGIGVGRAIVIGLEAANLPLPSEVYGGEAHELGRFEHSLSASFEEVDRVIDQLVASGVAGEAIEILQAHKTLLADPHLQATVRQAIRDDRISALHAVEAAIQPLIEQFSRMEVVSLREKAHDLLDIRRQLLSHLGLAMEAQITGDPENPVVVLADALTPAQTASLDTRGVAAVVTQHGSLASHMSILAQSLGIPAVAGVANLLERARRGDQLLVDGDNGFVFVNPAHGTLREYAERKTRRLEAERLLDREIDRLGASPDAHEIEINLGFDGELTDALASGARSVGLLRTEFFFMQRADWPTVEDQIAFYGKVLQAFDRVTVRLIDIGGDKQLPYLDVGEEPNPLLGFRSIRFLLDHPKIFSAQLRAILRAAKEAPQTQVRIMVPMITTPWEMRAARELFGEAVEDVKPPQVPPFGMMIEVPSVLYQLETFLPLADFFSIGSNDLVQYLLAVDRTNERVRNRYQPHHPAVLRALAQTIERLDAHQRMPSVCGEMAGRTTTALALMALGYRRFSVAPPAVRRIRHLSQRLSGVDLASLREALLGADGAEETEWLLKDHLRKHAPQLLEL